MTCRHCGAPDGRLILDLGHQPPSNAYLAEGDLSRCETVQPLRLRLCESCWLLQTEDYTAADAVFTPDYAYFSSVSTSWCAHAKAYAKAVTERLGLGAQSHVVEIASNDGYLLRNFVAAGIPCLGIEPTDSTARAAEAQGVPTLRRFFGRTLGQELRASGRAADLVIGNNVYAHVPDINDFTHGIAALLKPEGVVTLEFPHVLRLLEGGQFDTVYHEHFSYLSLLTVTRIFAAAGLRIFDVEELPTHGGSLRVWGCLEAAAQDATPRVAACLAEERARGIDTGQAYARLQGQAEAARDGLRRFLEGARAAGQSVAGYGAAAKGNTLLNFAGVTPDLLPYVCDAAPSKQGRFLPGSHIPILPPEALRARRPDVVLILPWNIASEVRAQLADLAGTGMRFATAVPELEIA
jgi:hypothetical protein